MNTGLRAIQDSTRERQGGLVVLIDLPTKQPQTKHAPPSAGFFIAAGNALSSCTQAMPLHTLTTVTLLTELLLALRANNAEGFKLIKNKRLNLILFQKHN